MGAKVLDAQDLMSAAESEAQEKMVQIWGSQCAYLDSQRCCSEGASASELPGGLGGWPLSASGLQVHSTLKAAL